jgi:hypothetical protein
VDYENRLTRRQQCLKIFPRFPFGAVSTSEWQPEAVALQALAHIVAFPPNFPCHSSERNRSTGAVQNHHTHHRISQQQFDLFQAQNVNLCMKINRQRLQRKKEADDTKSVGNTKTLRANGIQGAIKPHPISGINKPVTKNPLSLVHHQAQNAGFVGMAGGGNCADARDNFGNIPKIENVLAFAGGGEKALADAFEQSASG